MENKDALLKRSCYNASIAGDLTVDHEHWVPAGASRAEGQFTRQVSMNIH
ncbi:MAG: hypothetical protein OSA43_09140 [Pirellulales bacterium]|nr:hypothetical protein [Pirellulales bacterium]